MRSRIVLAALAALIVAGCDGPGGGGSATPRATYGPMDYLPNFDTPLTGASDLLQKAWKPYQVKTIPGQHTLDHLPPTPAVANQTNGAVPDSVAKHWADALVRTLGWARWAGAAGQSDFLPHLGQALSLDRAVFDRGGTYALPDCAVTPTSLALAGINPDRSRVSHYAFLATFAGPCAASLSFHDGHKESAVLWESNTLVQLNGWLVADPALGDIWLADQNISCEGVAQLPVCAEVLPGDPAPVAAPPALPADDVNFLNAPPRVQAAWAPYGAHIIPSRHTLSDIPDLPAVTNQTGGAVSDALARRWALALFRDLGWLRWSWSTAQLQFQHQLGDASFYSGPLFGPASGGGLAQLPRCASFPKELTLDLTDPDQMASGNTAVYRFHAVFQAPCSVQMHFPDGHNQSVDMPEKLDFAGSLRSDPLLGDIFYVEQSQTTQDPVIP
jgi:hypothetical protein